jgi:hypothetical protein
VLERKPPLVLVGIRIKMFFMVLYWSWENHIRKKSQTRSKILADTGVGTGVGFYTNGIQG